jgi:hypothetical protein
MRPNPTCPQGRFLTLALLLLVGTFSTRAVAEEPDVAKERAKAEVDEIWKRVVELAKRDDLDGILAVARTVPTKWADVDPDLATGCLRKICGGLSAWDLREGDCAKAVAQDLVLQELERRSPALPLELDLAQLLRLRRDRAGQPLPKDEFIALRARYLALWARVWLRLDAAIDPAWVRTRTGMWPRPPAGYREGTPPEAVKEPELRTAYAEAWKAHFDAKTRDKEQMDLRALQDPWFVRMLARFVAAAREEPRLAADDLRALLKGLRSPKDVDAIVAQVEGGAEPAR